MHGYVALLPIAAIVLLLWNARGTRSRVARLAVRIALVVLALASVAAAYGGALREAVRTPYGRPDAWGLFHYYLGAKYFDELDYASFYACALAADRDGGRIWDADTRVRDLSSYAIVGREDVAPCPRGRFSPARWREFTRDVGALQAILPERQRAGVLTDKGFNPPPSWAVPAGWLANHVPLDHVRAVTVVFNLDLAFALASVLAIALTIGVDTAMLAAVFLFLYFGSFERLTGTFLQYAWLPALTGAFLAWRAHRYRQSAGWWALATALQTFPLVLTGAVALRCLWLRTKDADADASGRYRRFFGHYAMWLAVGVSVGCLSARGAGAWRQWAHKISAHGNYLVGEVFDIGLRNLIATAASPGVADAHSYAQDYPNVAARLAAFASYEWVWYVAVIGTLAYVLWRMRAVTHAGVLALGFVMMYVFLDLSPYYYSSLTLLFVCFPLNGTGGGLLIHLGLLGLLAYHAAEMPTGYVTFHWSEHLVSEILIAGFILALLLVATRPRLTAEDRVPAPVLPRRAARSRSRGIPPA